MEKITENQINQLVRLGFEQGKSYAEGDIEAEASARGRTNSLIVAIWENKPIKLLFRRKLNIMRNWWV